MEAPLATAPSSGTPFTARPRKPAIDAEFKESEHPRQPDGKFGAGGGASLAGSSPQTSGPRGSGDVHSLGDLKEFADVKLPPDDDKHDYYYHSIRWDGDTQSILENGVQVGGAGRTWLSKDEIRDRGAGFVILRVPKGSAEEGVDRVEPGLQYREFTVNKTIPPSDIVKSVGYVRLGQGGHGIREDQLADFALKSQGANTTEVKELPEKYQKWFHLNKQAQDAAIEAAGIILVTKEGRALFLRRADIKDQDHVGEWCWPGGKVDAGEDAETAAIREVREETGWIKPEDNTHEMHELTVNEDDEVTFTTFEQQVGNEFIPTLNEEHDGWAWAPLDSPPLPLHPGCEETLDMALGAGIAKEGKKIA